MKNGIYELNSFQFKQFRFLIKNELLFVAEREIEVHIWKVVDFQAPRCLPHLVFSDNTSSKVSRC